MICQKLGGGGGASPPSSGIPVGETEKDEKNPAWHARAAVALEQERPEEGQTGAGFVNFFS